jgi:flagellar hook assembly protein FlgD
MDTSNAAGIPEETALAQNYPNPFNSQTTISFTVPRRSKVALRIYNVLGQLVRTLADEVREPGVSVLPWDGRDHKGVQVASGVYFYRLETEGAILARKLVLVK